MRTQTRAGTQGVLSSFLSGSELSNSLSSPVKMLPCRHSRHLALLIVSIVASSCGTANEKEQVSEGPAADTRYEIVIVDSSGQIPAIDDASPAAESAADGSSTRPTEQAPAVDTPPPPPGIDDEAGGDQLLAFSPDGHFVVQVGVYAEIAKARTRVRQLVELGYPAFLSKRKGTSQTRVRIGFFGSRDDADHFGQRFVRDHGGEFWVDLRADTER